MHLEVHKVVHGTVRVHHDHHVSHAQRQAHGEL
jgi:hypothetical protein